MKPLCSRKKTNEDVKHRNNANKVAKCENNANGNSNHNHNDQ